MNAKSKIKGFTLIETLLVLVIISIMIYASIGFIQQRALQSRIDRTSTQMQQILNAGLSYYVAKNEWPATLADLQTAGYLPPATVALKNPWGKDYTVASSAQLFYVYTSTETVSSGAASSIANVIAGTLPLSYTATSTGTPPAAGSPCTNQNTCYIVASVNIPGQNLNNARAINFAGLYKHGACVPVPECPVDVTGTTMTPQVFVAPVQVAGTFDGGTATSSPPNGPNVYPISSFSAYAVGPSTSGGTPGACASGGAATACTGGAPTNPKYWRVCMQVVTERGIITSSATGWGDNQRLLALTRCVGDNEPAGSGFTVFTN